MSLSVPSRGHLESPGQSTFDKSLIVWYRARRLNKTTTTVVVEACDGALASAFVPLPRRARPLYTQKGNISTLLEAWKEKAKALQCPTCGEWILVGITGTGRYEAASIEVITPQNVVTYLGENRKMYALMGDGYLVPLGKGSTEPMVRWRPAHPCGVPDMAPETPTAAPVGPGVASARGDRTAGSVAPPSDPCASEDPASPVLGCVGRARRSIIGCQSCNWPKQDDVVPFDNTKSETGIQSGLEQLLVKELGAEIIERSRRGRIIYRSKHYSDAR